MKALGHKVLVKISGNQQFNFVWGKVINKGCKVDMDIEEGDEVYFDLKASLEIDDNEGLYLISDHNLILKK